jgi:hypothetical protein
MTTSIFGSVVHRVEDPRFLTGRSRYVDDLRVEGALRAVFVRSIMSHARLVGMERDPTGRRMKVRAATVACVLLAASCSQVTDALRPSPTPSQTPSPTAVPSASPSDGAIVVRRPQPGEEVTSPVIIVGDADVFEATVSIRILDAEGLELAASFTTADCGSGCRGEFSTEVFFFTPQRQEGTIEVFETSAEDGSQVHLVRIPVVLVPGA